MGKRKSKITTARRTGAKIHMRDVSELCYLCRHTRDKINEIEKIHNAAIEQGLAHYRKAMEMKKAGNQEEYERNMAQYKQMYSKYSKTWFTNTVNKKGRIDLSGDYKKIKASQLKKFLIEAEDTWARKNKEPVLGINMITTDLRWLRVLTSSNARTHRPVDWFGKKILEEGNVSQIEEYRISEMDFFADFEPMRHL